MNKARRTPLLMQAGLAWAVTVAYPAFAAAAWAQGTETASQDQAAAEDSTPIIIIGLRPNWSESLP